MTLPLKNSQNVYYFPSGCAIMRKSMPFAKEFSINESYF